MQLPTFFQPAKSPKKINGTPILIVDFGTSELRAAVCKEDGGKIKALSLAKIPYPAEIIYFGRIINPKEAAAVLKSAFQEAAASLAKKDYPQRIAFTLWGEVLRAQTTTGRLTFSGEEKLITPKKIKEVLQKLSEGALIEVSQQWVRQTGREDLEIEEYETRISKIKIGSQTYQDLDDLRRNLPDVGNRELEINQTAIYIDKKQQEIFDKLAKAIKLPVVNLVFGPQALLRAQEALNNLAGEKGQFAEEKPAMENALVFDIDGRTTTIALIFENNLWSSKVLGLGGDDFIAFLALRLNLTFEQALQKVLNFSNNDLDDAEKVKISGLLSEVLETWSKGLELSLSEIEGVKVYPELILLGGGGILFPKIKEFLENYSWSRVLAFAQEPKFEFLDLDRVKDLFDFRNVEYDKVRDFWLFVSALSQNLR